MIVKVQLSIYSHPMNQRMLIYNKDKSLMYEGKATKEVKKLMGEKNKDFFVAHMNEKKEIVLDTLAKWRNW